jgi:hypothetical protein
MAQEVMSPIINRAATKAFIFVCAPIIRLP